MIWDIFSFFSDNCIIDALHPYRQSCNAHEVLSNHQKKVQPYIWNDSLGNATDIFRYKDQSNFNKGLDGVTPLVAGICSPAQVGRLMKHLFSPDELWTKVGLSTVDQSAPYYKEDGYWNGAVWFPRESWTTYPKYPLSSSQE